MNKVTALESSKFSERYKYLEKTAAEITHENHVKFMEKHKFESWLKNLYEKSENMRREQEQNPMLPFHKPRKPRKKAKSQAKPESQE